MLRSKYAVYILSSKSKGTSVERRFSDFDNLRKELQKMYPGYIVPSIPKKKVGKAFEPAFLQKRKVQLQNFLKEIMFHPLLRSSELIITFLTMTSKDWENKSKAFAKTTPPKDISSFKTLEGSANVTLTKESELYCEKLSMICSGIKEEYKNLKACNKAIANDFEKLAETIAKTGTSYHKIANAYNSLNCKDHSVLFMFMGDLHQKLSDAYKTIKENYLVNFCEFYKFYKHETESLEELLTVQKTMFDNFITNEKKLWKKKETLFEQKNIVKWKLDSSLTTSVESLLKNKGIAFVEMLPDETNDIQKLKMVYGFYSNKLMEEFARIISKDKAVIKEHYETIPSLFMEREMHLQKIWSELFKKTKALQLDPDDLSRIKNS